MSDGGPLDGVALVDHHCHGVVTIPLSRERFELLATESDHPAPDGCSGLDTQLGFAVRRWCAPVLGLDPHAPAEEYLAQRARLGVAEVNRRLLRAAGVATFLVDTGYQAGDVLGPAEMAEAAGAGAAEVVRLEPVAEQAARTAGTAAGFAAAYAEALGRASAGAVAVKSIIAYRYGLDFDPDRPSAREVREAAARWLRRAETGDRRGPARGPGPGDRPGPGDQPGPGGGTDAGGTVRLDDPVLLRHVLWTGVDRGLPLQFHTGFGDPDLRLDRCDPARMTGFLRAVQDRDVPIMLLHCYPYHRQAGYLAQVFPHVYLDVGLAVNHVGAAATAVVAESLELAPFHKVLYSSDAFGLPELHLLGAVLFRGAFGEVVRRWTGAGLWSAADAERVARMVGAGNAERVYGLAGGPAAEPGGGDDVR